MSAADLGDSDRVTLLQFLQEAHQDSQAARDHWQGQVRQDAETRAKLVQAFYHQAETGELPAGMNVLTWGTSDPGAEEQHDAPAEEQRLAAVQGGWRATCRRLTGVLRDVGLVAQAKGIRRALKSLEPYPDPEHLDGVPAWEKAEAEAAGQVVETVRAVLGEIEGRRGGAVASAAGITVAELRELVGASETTMRKYTQWAGVQLPGPGRKDHRFTEAEAKKVLTLCAKELSDKKLRERCQQSLLTLAKNRTKTAF